MNSGLGSAGLLHKVVFLMRSGTGVRDATKGDATKPRPQRGFGEDAMRSNTSKYLVSAGTC